ncbi:D-lactaldehyde dehydrogenase [Mycena rosella]|uniref:D-lactaldehyde dehydrogenase n=1 Tax=Mycena rosella TaxID=1033263 RepID=A0AAD7DBS3_MYCRO|nr:D-lactaldehyde dehydrogenase [Mycena rosella]
MPAITDISNARILVSGANGFLASWIVGDLLRKGYSVRAAVREKAKGRNLLKMYEEYGRKLELSLVNDMNTEGAFDDAVKGVQGIIHTASPVHLDASHPKGKITMIDPAVNGQLAMLTSAMKHGSSVQRIIITSSCAAILDTVPDPTKDSATVSELNWNMRPVEQCEKLNSHATGLDMYSASKTLAEKAAWDFVDANKSTISWDLTMLNPPWIFGPVKHEVSSLASLNSSCKMWADAVLNGDLGGYPDPLHFPGHGWVDVRDVSEAHVRALTVPAAGGERIIVCAGAFVWQDFSVIFPVDSANALLPAPAMSLAKGTLGTVHRAITFDTAKERRILGIDYKTMTDSTQDILTDYVARGWC